MLDRVFFNKGYPNQCPSSIHSSDTPLMKKLPSPYPLLLVSTEYPLELLTYTTLSGSILRRGIRGNRCFWVINARAIT